MYDDIDWTYASWDWGVVKLCREMEMLANPIAALGVGVRRRGRSSQRTARPADEQLAPIPGVLEAA